MPGDEFYSLTGTAYSLENIVEYNRNRTPDSELKETAQAKYLFDPITKKLFSTMDSERIVIASAKQKKKYDDWNDDC